MLFQAFLHYDCSMCICHFGTTSCKSCCFIPLQQSPTWAFNKYVVSYKVRLQWTGFKQIYLFIAQWKILGVPGNVFLCTLMQALTLVIIFVKFSIWHLSVDFVLGIYNTCQVTGLHKWYNGKPAKTKNSPCRTQICYRNKYMGTIL